MTLCWSKDALDVRMQCQQCMHTDVCIQCTVSARYSPMASELTAHDGISTLGISTPALAGVVFKFRAFKLASTTTPHTTHGAPTSQSRKTVRWGGVRLVQDLHITFGHIWTTRLLAWRCQNFIQRNDSGASENIRTYGKQDESDCSQLSADRQNKAGIPRKPHEGVIEAKTRQSTNRHDEKQRTLGEYSLKYVSETQNEKRPEGCQILV